MNFLIIAMVALVPLTLLAAPLGCLVLWRRLAYFGDTLSHSALLGIAVALFFHVPVLWGLLALTLLVGLTLAFWRRVERYHPDTLLTILSQGALATGLVLFSLQGVRRTDLTAYLVGDILSLGGADIYLILAGTFTLLLILVIFWRPLVTLTISEDLAFVEGHNVLALRLLLMGLLAALVALALPTVGALLISGLLILPAAIARSFARSPEGMARGALLAGMVMVSGGLYLSLHADIPPSASVVAVGCVLWLFSLLKSPKI